MVKDIILVAVTGFVCACGGIVGGYVGSHLAMKESSGRPPAVTVKVPGKCIIGGKDPSNPTITLDFENGTYWEKH